MSYNKFIQEKETLNKLLKSLLEKNIEKSEKRTKEQLSIILSSKENMSKMSEIISDFKKKINNKLSSKRKSFNDKDFFNKNNKCLIINKSRIKPNLLNKNKIQTNNKITFNNNHNNNDFHKSKSKKDNNSRPKSKSKKVNYYKNIQNNYSINLYGDKIIISNDNKINCHNSKFKLKKINTMFNLYKKSIKNKPTNDNSLIPNLTSRYISTNNSLLDPNETKSRSRRKKSATNLKKNIINIFKKDKKIIRKKTPCNNNNKKKSLVDNLKNSEGSSNHTHSHSINLKNLNKKEDKIINDMMTLNSTINNDDLIFTNYNLYSLEDENFEEVIEIVNTAPANNIKENPNYMNFSKDINTNYLDDFINKEYFNIIFDYLKIEELLQIRGISKLYNNSIITYLIKEIEKERSKIIKIISSLKINKENIKGNDEICLDSFQFNKTSLKAVNLLNEQLLNKLFYNNKIPNNDILLIYKIFFYIINHPIKDINITEKKKFWENCRLYLIKESGGKIGNFLFNIVKEKRLCLNKRNIYNIYKLIENNFNKINPSYFSNICGTTGLFVFFIKDILDFLGLTNDKVNIHNSFVTYSNIIEELDRKLLILRNYQK